MLKLINALLLVFVLVHSKREEVGNKRKRRRKKLIRAAVIEDENEERVPRSNKVSFELTLNENNCKLDENEVISQILEEYNCLDLVSNEKIHNYENNHDHLIFKLNKQFNDFDCIDNTLISDELDECINVIEQSSVFKLDALSCVTQNNLDSVQAQPNYGLEVLDYQSNGNYQKSTAMDNSYVYLSDSATPASDIYIFDGGIDFTHAVWSGSNNPWDRMDPGFCDRNIPCVDNETLVCKPAGQCTSDTIKYHGTHVASLAGSLKYGSSKNFKIIDVNVCHVKVSTSETVWCDNADILLNLQRVIKNVTSTGRKGVINLSIGMTCTKGTECSLFDSLVKQLIKLKSPVVMSAGNQKYKPAWNILHAHPGYSTHTHYRAGSNKYVISVGAKDRNNDPAYFSLYGDYSIEIPMIDTPNFIMTGVTVWAPGVNFTQESQDGNSVTYDKSGTSFSTPLVTGIIANYLSVYPNILDGTLDSFDDLITLLHANSDTLNSCPHGNNCYSLLYDCNTNPTPQPTMNPVSVTPEPTSYVEHKSTDVLGLESQANSYKAFNLGRIKRIEWGLYNSSANGGTHKGINIRLIEGDKETVNFMYGNKFYNSEHTCTTVSLADNEFINRVRTWYGTINPSTYESVKGIRFYTNLGNLYNCRVSDYGLSSDNRYWDMRNCKGKNNHLEWELTGINGGSGSDGHVIQFIQYQFMQHETVGTPTNDAECVIDEEITPIRGLSGTSPVLSYHHDIVNRIDWGIHNDATYSGYYRGLVITSIGGELWTDNTRFGSQTIDTTCSSMILAANEHINKVESWHGTLSGESTYSSLKAIKFISNLNNEYFCGVTNYQNAQFHDIDDYSTSNKNWQLTGAGIQHGWIIDHIKYEFKYYSHTNAPTAVTVSPTSNPTKTPTVSPSKSPSQSPSNSPSISPTNNPSNHPSLSPSRSPSNSPSKSPSQSPSKSPSTSPSNSPSITPTANPTGNPVGPPTASTNDPSQSPSNSPSKSPTNNPSKSPSNSPSKSPTHHPSVSPSNSPSKFPTKFPTVNPSNNPSNSPSISPTKNPTSNPSKSPTESPVSAASCNWVSTKKFTGGSVNVDGQTQESCCQLAIDGGYTYWTLKINGNNAGRCKLITTANPGQRNLGNWIAACTPGATHCTIY